jgi:myosin heavy subunit
MTQFDFRTGSAKNSQKTQKMSKDLDKLKSYVSQQFANIEKEINNFKNNVSHENDSDCDLELAPKPSAGGQNSMSEVNQSSFNIAELLDKFQKKIYSLEDQLATANDNLKNLENNNNELKSKISSLSNEVDRLKENKTDNSEIDSLLSEKADNKTLNAKVSREAFDKSISDLTSQMEAVLTKVASMETLYNCKVEGVVNSLSSKLDNKEMEAFKNSLENRLKCLKKLLEAGQNKEDLDHNDIEAMSNFFRKPMIGFQNVQYDNNAAKCNAAANQQQGPIASIPTAGKLPHMDTIRPYTTFDMHSIRNQAQTKFRTTLDERDFLRHNKNDEHNYRGHVAESMNYAFNAYASGHMSKYADVMPVSGGPSIPKGYGIPKLGRSCGGTYTTTSPAGLTPGGRRYQNMEHDIWHETEGNETSIEQKIQRQFNRPSEEVELQGHNGHIYKGRIE